MNFTLTASDAKRRAAMIARFNAERASGKATGNYSLTTSAGFRLAVASFDPEQVRAYLLAEMGIGEQVTADTDGLTITVRSRHDSATILAALRGAFRVMSLIHEDGRQIIKVLGFSAPQTQPKIYP